MKKSSPIAPMCDWVERERKIHEEKCDEEKSGKKEKEDKEGKRKWCLIGNERWKTSGEERSESRKEAKA